MMISQDLWRKKIWRM